MVFEYVLLAVLLVAAIFIVIAVVLSPTSDEGLSGTIAGGSDTFLGRDKSQGGMKKVYTWTIIAVAVFGIAALVAHIIQPDYAYAPDIDYWKNMTEYYSVFS